MTTKNRNNQNKPRLTDKEKARCVAAYLDCGTIKGASRKTGFSEGAIKSAVKQCKDFETLYAEKRRQEAEQLFGALSAKSKKFLDFVDIFFDTLADEEVMKRICRSDPEKAARIFGITVDKYMMIHKIKQDEGSGDSSITVNIVRKKREREEDDDE